LTKDVQIWYITTMAFRINYNEEKNQLLKATRGICFDDVISALKEKKLLADKQHTSTKFTYQRIYVIQIGKYVCAVPYVINKQKKEIFLKTVYPSRVLNKQYSKKGKSEKTKK